MSRAMYKHMVEQMSELEMQKKKQKEHEDEMMKMKLAQAIKVSLRYPMINSDQLSPWSSSREKR